MGDFDLSLVRNQDILKAVLNDGKAVFYDFKFESNYVEVFLILRLESHFFKSCAGYTIPCDDFDDCKADGTALVAAAIAKITQ